MPRGMLSSWWVFAASAKKTDQLQPMGKAAAQGQLTGLAGEGRPLPDRAGEALVDPALAAGHRIMAEAGALPEEFRIKAELEAARRAWQQAEGAAAKKAAMARIADLQMRYDMARDARRAFFR